MTFDPRPSDLRPADEAEPAVSGADARTRAWLIENPAAGQSDWEEQIAAAQATLREAGWAVTLRRTAGPGDATTFAREAVAAGADVVVVAGATGRSTRRCKGWPGSAAPRWRSCRAARSTSGRPNSA